METTIDLPNDLLKQAKLRATHENRRLDDVVADALRLGLARPDPGRKQASRRARLPLIDCAHPAHPREELTPERVHATQLADEVERLDT